ncbi:Chromosomal replication initiator protein DnaA [Planctomycetes bacterium Pan216]|uniref:Chromosomal replication initiator protein DnaA n=1 Tax=Kolteria novifilia TaxID=2527975 RepID=A0A518AWR9_9BACT|nr:Chromosomal replication initiator protein DnaA [Planctomycetes bacterium Pan216]
MVEANPNEYALESLVRGEENVLAISALNKVIHDPGERYNPLFIFGPPSVGKTHMLYALRNRFEEDHPDWNILSIPAGEFLEECEQAWQEKTTPEFRQQLWKLDVLLIDDVHTLINRPAALEELYHAFNRLVADSRQLVLTSRLAPAEMTDLPTAMRTRFQSGLVVNIETPRERLMQDILEQQCQWLEVNLAKTASRFLCREVRSIRELHGVIHHFAEHRNGNGRPIGLPEVKDTLEKHAAQQLTIADVAREACQYFHVDLNKVRSASRLQSLVQARQMAMYLAREMTTAPLTEIGSFFGGRDHTTVLYACRKIGEEVRQNSSFYARSAREIRSMLRG